MRSTRTRTTFSKALGVRSARHFLFDIYRNSVLRFLLVGGLSFALDLGLLIALHELFAIDLLIATPIAFVVSLVFNFFLQRIFTFQASNHHGISAVKYLSLVAFNIAVTDVIVASFDAFGWSYVVGKGTAAVLTTTWNYFLYKEWIFKGRDKLLGKI